MKRICTHLLLAAAVCLALFVLAGCEDSSSGSASDSFGGLVSMTAEAETTAVSESRTTARLTEAAGLDGAALQKVYDDHDHRADRCRLLGARFRRRGRQGLL